MNSLSLKLQLALSALLEHCIGLVASGQLARDEEQKLQQLIRQIKRELTGHEEQ